MTTLMTRAAAGLAAVLSLLLAGSLPLLVHAATVPAADDAASSLTTLAERSGLRQTGRYDEVIRLCDAFAQQFPQAVRCERFGTTPEGRPMLALIVSARGAFTPEAAQQLQLPVMLIQGGIHAGEIDGKDAGFIALRQALRRRDTTLQRQVLVFVPVFNVDGHERFGAWNRPNQRGPKEMGWRTTAQNYNLNRDYAKVDSPEMAAMLAMGLLGAVLTFAGQAVYAPHFYTTLAWGMTPLEDQQAAGLIMWAPASALYLFAALAVLGRMLGPTREVAA